MKKSKMADFEVALTTESSGDNFCVSLWDLNSGMQLKAYKGGSCQARCVSLLGKDYIMASQSNKPIIHTWNMAKVGVFVAKFKGKKMRCFKNFQKIVVAFLPYVK